MRGGFGWVDNIGLANNKNNLAPFCLVFFCLRQVYFSLIFSLFFVVFFMLFLQRNRT